MLCSSHGVIGLPALLVYQTLEGKAEKRRDPQEGGFLICPPTEPGFVSWMDSITQVNRVAWPGRLPRK